jgi:hypothetical protein
LEIRVDNLQPDLWFGNIRAIFLTLTSKLLAIYMPEQAALRLNNATRAKAISGLLTPWHESYPENSFLVKMSVNLLLQITISIFWSFAGFNIILIV